jgi:hypothetical protein
MSIVSRAAFLQEEIKTANDLSVCELGIKMFRVHNRSTKPNARLLHSLTEITINRHLGFYPHFGPRPVIMDFKEAEVTPVKLEFVPSIVARKLTGAERRGRNRALKKERHFAKKDREKKYKFGK